MLSRLPKVLKFNRVLFSTKSVQVPSEAAAKISKPDGNALKDIDPSKVYQEYKKYPLYSHGDPKSKNYIPAERDEYNEETATNAYNHIITRFKADLKMQKEVYEALQKMDRPYLNGIPGVHKNVPGKAVKEGYSPAGYKTPVETPDENENYSRNEDRFLNQTIFTPKYEKMTHYDVLWQQELDTRPTTSKFHHDKGFKYDVPVPYEERWPHVADRLGHPEILGTPFERLMRLEGDIYHPNYLNQPFIQTPSPDPHPSLDFQEGEVVYENTRILEWAKFWSLSGLSIYAFLGLFVPYNLIYKTHLFLPSASEGLYLTPHNFSVYFFDSLQVHIPVVAGVAGYLTYGAFTLWHRILKDYVVKMQYSKDKELLFVTRISPYCSIEEEVYETAHLEMLPPSVKSGLAQFSIQDKDGLWELTCMNTQRFFVLYNENKYWNPALKQEFLQKTMGLWKDYAEPVSRSEEGARNMAEPVLSIEAAK